MRILGSIAATSVLLSACGSGGEPSAPAPAPAPGNVAAPVAQGPEPRARLAIPNAQDGVQVSSAGWEVQPGSESTVLLLTSGGRPVMQFSCPESAKTALVNVPGFRPIGSEERLSIGGGGGSAALVADGRGDRKRGGVTAAGPVPEVLAALAGGPVTASYGAQRSGPHPAPPRALSSAFAAACRKNPEAPGEADREPAARVASASPCGVQDGKPVRSAAIRAVGTEPFWNARVEGRCVTYSNPEDQKGSRVWTRFAAAPGGGTWSGSLNGSRFELRVRPERGCSDGMSDKRYPLSAELVVGGQRHRGCAEAL